MTTDPSSSVTVDYTIAVPKDIGRIMVTSQLGPVTVEEGTNCPLDVATSRGTITIHEAAQSLTAKTGRGTIFITQKKLDPKGSLFIETIEKGDIKLALPKKINADLNARTFRGTLTCTIPITLAARTTVLTKESWGRMRREARGTLGSSGPPITIDVTKGDITITGR